MKAARLFIGLLTILLTLPITIYLQFRILQMVGATEAMWFLFWINMPLYILVQVIAKFCEEK